MTLSRIHDNLARRLGNIPSPSERFQFSNAKLNLILVVLLLFIQRCDSVASKSSLEDETLDAKAVTNTADSWDGPVQTVEREESVVNVNLSPQNDHEIQEDDRYHEEELETNRVVPLRRPTKVTTTHSTTTTLPEPSSATRFGAAGALFFTAALLFLVEF